MNGMENYKWLSHLFLYQEFGQRLLGPKLFQYVKSMEIPNRKYLPDPKNLRDSVTVLCAVSLSIWQQRLHVSGMLVCELLLCSC